MMELTPRFGRHAGIGLLSALVAMALGLAIIAFAPLRGRPDEALAGGYVILITLGLAAWLVTSSARSRALPNIAALGWAVQVAASMTYHYAAFARDALLYHSTAARIAETRASIEFPSANWGNEGVFFILASLYRVTGASILLGFVVFASLALVGKTLFARAMLSLTPLLGRPAEWIAVGIVLLPSFVWWTAAITKEAIVVLGMGIVFASLFRPNGKAPSFVGIATGLAIITLVRAHVTLLLAVSVFLYLFLAFRLPARRGGRRAWSIALAATVVAVGVLLGVNYLGAEGIGGLGDVREDLAERSAVGGSTIETRPVRTPLDLPQAVFTLMFRPTLLEFFSVITLAQAVETTVFGLLLLWIVRERGRRRYEVRTGADAIQLRAIRWFGWFYGASFIYAWSGVSYNLGLISRQRAHVWMPLLLALAASIVNNHRAMRRPSGPPKRSVTVERGFRSDADLG